MPRVLLLCEYATLNGGERSMLATLDGVARAGFAIAVAAPPQGPLAEALRAKAVETVPFAATGSDGRRRPQPQLREELAGLIARVRPDVVHANSLSMGRLSGPVAAEASTPSIAHLRDILRLAKGPVADLNRHARLLAVSQATLDYHAAQGMDREKLHVLRNGVDLADFRPRPATGYLHRELCLPQDALLAATIGQVGLRKGHDVLASAAAEVIAREPRLHFLLVGERHSQKAESREFEAALHRQAEPLGGRFHFLGNRDDVRQLLNEVALVVHPARQEPLGRVLLEAAASGVAVVATDVGGTREIFPDGQYAARLVSPDDPAQLAGAILELIGDDDGRARMAGAARRRAEKAFDVRRAAEELIGHYREVVTAGQQRG
jgi:glycosyltransferase involved in cell wall biosynthesis